MVIPFVPYQETLPSLPEPFDPVPYARREIDSAVATFMDEIVSAKTVTRALELKREIEECALVLLTLESAALERADRLCRERES
jgi:phytoene dehydrogenase-like protein